MSKQDRNMLRIMGALSAGRKKKSSSFKNIPEQVITPTKKRNKFNSPPRSSRLLLMHPIMEFTWYTYIYRQVWQLTCDYRVCWISRHKRMVSLPDTFWFPSMSDNRHNTHTHTHLNHFWVRVAFSSQIMSLLKSTRSIRGLGGIKSITPPHFSCFKQRWLAGFAYSPFCITYTYVSTILHKWVCWSGSPNKCDKNLI